MRNVVGDRWEGGGRTRTIGRSVITVIGALALVAVLLPMFGRSASAEGSAPGAISSLTVASRTEGTITLQWSSPSAGGSAITDYAVEKSQDGTNWSSIAHDPFTASTFIVPNLNLNIALTFRVAAINANGRGPWAVVFAATAIGVGMNNTCEITPASDVWCWGDNTYLALGAPKSNVRRTPQKTSVTGAAEVAVGEDFTCVRYVSGSVDCWGTNDEGQLGDGTTTSRDTAARVSLSGPAKQIVASRKYACALLVAGTVQCWGEGTAGQLGNGLTPAYSAIPLTVYGLTGVKEISVGRQFGCALLTAGNVKCWGRNKSMELGNFLLTNSPIPVNVDGFGDWLPAAKQITSGEAHSCAALVDGSVRCWGSDSMGQSGGGSMIGIRQPGNPAVMTSGAAEVRAGSKHTCARLTDGTMKCWGDRSSGQLGDGTITSTGSPTPVAVSGLVGVTAVSAAGANTCAMVDLGAVWCWGSNRVSQIGDGYTTDTATPHPVRESTSGTPVAPTGVAVTSATDTTATVTWSAAGGRYAPVDTYRIEVSVDGAPATLAAETFWDVRSYTVTGLARGSTYRISVRATNRNGSGRSGTATVAVGTVPGAVRSLSVVSRSTGQVGLGWTSPADNGGLAIIDHLVQYRATGGEWTTFAHEPSTDNSITVTGLTSGSTYDFRVAAVNGIGTGPSLDVDRATGVDAGSSSTCSTLANGTVECWGANDHGQLGNGTFVGSTEPILVPGIDTATQVSVGTNFACALLAGGGVRCWGANLYGQLGDGSTNESASPVSVSGITDAVQISGGGEHACAVRREGEVRCWGYNADGELGNRSFDNSSIPVVVSSLVATSVSAGGNHTCAVGTDTNGYCWGMNFWGQLGNSTKRDAYVPQLVQTNAPVSRISAGPYASCAVLVAGGVKCWGSDMYGAVGDGPASYSDVTTPVSVDLLGKSAVSVSMGLSAACATLVEGSLYCWGNNPMGHVGLGGASYSASPSLAVASGVADASVGAEHSCLVLVAGGVKCAGSGASGRLGTSSTSSSSTFTSTVPMSSRVFVVGPPEAPANASVRSVTSSSVVLAWGAPANDGGCAITDYVIAYSTNSSDWTTFSDGVSPTTGVTVTGLTSGTGYAFSVTSVSTCAVSAESSTVLASTHGVPGQIEELMKIGNATTSMSLIWVAPGSDGGVEIAGYDVDWSTDGVNWSDAPFSTSTSRLITGLSAGTTYSLRIAAINTVGTGPYYYDSFRTAGPPTAPTALERTAATNSTLGLSWIAPTETSLATITNYSVQYRIGSGSWSTFTHADSSSTSITVTGLIAATNYSIRVAAVTSYGIGDYVTGSFTTAGPPDAPTGLTVTGRTITSVSLSWLAPQNNGGSSISNYKVEYRVGSGSWSTFTHAVSSATTITVTGLTAGSTMSFRVSAISSFGTSSPSSTVTQITAVAPSAPTALTVTARTKTSVSLSWTAPTGTFGAGITDYVIKVSTDGQTFTTVTRSVSTSTSATVSNLSTGTHYWFKVQAVNSQGASPASATVEPWTSVLPGAPSGPYVTTKTATSVGLTWNPPIDNGGRPVTDFVVQYLKSGAVSWVTVSHTPSISNELNVTGLTKGSTYSFRVAAVTGEGTGPWATANGVIVATKPGAPTGLVSTGKTATSISLKWNAPIDNGGRAITDYVVEYRRANTLTWSTFSDGVSTATTATVTGLTRNASYVFRVSAKNPEGTGATSSTGTFIPSSLVVTTSGTPPFR